MHLIAQEKVTVIWGVPSTYRRLMNDPDFMKADFSSIVWCRCGAAPPSSDVMEQYWEKGITFCNGYGMTETSPGTLSMPAGSMTLDDIRAKHTSCGKLMPYNEAKIIDDNGKEVSDGTPGELLFRGSLLFSGYWNNDEATQAAMPDGWMHTGDIGLKDKDGFFYVIGRKKHMFISNGENIYPAEIESQLFVPGCRRCLCYRRSGFPERRSRQGSDCPKTGHDCNRSGNPRFLKTPSCNHPHSSIYPVRGFSAQKCSGKNFASHHRKPIWAQRIKRTQRFASAFWLSGITGSRPRKNRFLSSFQLKGMIG